MLPFRLPYGTARFLCVFATLRETVRKAVVSVMFHAKALRSIVGFSGHFRLAFFHSEKPQGHGGGTANRRAFVAEGLGKRRNRCLGCIVANTQQGLGGAGAHVGAWVMKQFGKFWDAVAAHVDHGPNQSVRGTGSHLRIRIAQQYFEFRHGRWAHLCYGQQGSRLNRLLLVAEQFCQTVEPFGAYLAECFGGGKTVVALSLSARASQ